MSERLTMIDWKSENFRLGKLKEYPEIMTQGELLEQPEENMRDVFGESATLIFRPWSPRDSRGFLKGIDTTIAREPDRF